VCDAADVSDDACTRYDTRMRGLAVLAMLGLGCGRLAFDPVGTVAEENVIEREVIAAGAQVSCVLRGDGSVWCWGDGRRGGLGNGTEEPRATPARVQSLPAVVAIDAGFEQVCALTENGDVWCWGDNSFGQVDGSSGMNTMPPTRVPLLRPALTVSGGRYHTCALLDDNSVACWGKNSSGQIGKGPLSGEHVLEHDVLDQVTSVATGYFHTCALRKGTVWCWGNNDGGQLGTGNGDDAVAPTELPGTVATSLAAGTYFTCALDGGRYRCWGDNEDGQLGFDGSSTNTPPAPSSLDDIVAIRAGASHTCALRKDESLWCWGRNTVGELGDGAGNGQSARSTVPIQIATTRVDVAAGFDHTCASEADGTVTCWGSDRFGAIGDPVRTTKFRPVEVPLPSAPTSLVAGGRFACAVLGGTQDLYCWGQNDDGQLAMPEGAAVKTPTFTGLSGVDNPTLGSNHGCATVAGVLNCWGANYRGQLGDGTATSRSTPMPVAMNLSGVAAGHEFSCGLLANDVYCWGSFFNGKLGGGAIADQLTPALAGATATNIDLGSEHACALEAGTATCWGFNQRGQLGRGTTSITEGPGAVTGFTDFAALTAGGEHTCGASATGGELYCWGLNSPGSLGTGDGDDRAAPAQIVASGGREVTARRNYTCAEIDGAAKCWGENNYGQLGTGFYDNTYTPTPVADVPAGVTLFALGDEFGCVLSGDGKVRCWGDNTYGQLGLGVLGFAPSPYTVTLP